MKDNPCVGEVWRWTDYFDSRQWAIFKITKIVNDCVYSIVISASPFERWQEMITLKEEVRWTTIYLFKCAVSRSHCIRISPQKLKCIYRELHDILSAE